MADKITVLPNLAGLKGVFSGIYEMIGPYKNAKLAQEEADKLQLTDAVYVESNWMMYYPKKGREHELSKYPPPEPVVYKPTPNPDSKASRNWLTSYNSPGGNIGSVAETRDKQPDAGNGTDNGDKK